MYVLLINDDHMQELHPTAQLIFSEDSTVRHKMKLGTQPPGLLIGQRPPRLLGSSFSRGTVVYRDRST